MTIGGALSELNNLLDADDIPCYYKPSIKAVMDTIALEQEPCEDAVSRQEVLDLIADYDLSMGQVVRGIHALPSVTPQEPQSFKWCTDCKEYDQDKHCCHRWSKVIRDTVEEMKQGYIECEVLDKIRAEIEARLCDVVSDYTDGYRTAIQGDLAILDKYKAETEAEDGNK